MSRERSANDWVSQDIKSKQKQSIKFIIDQTTKSISQLRRVLRNQYFYIFILRIILSFKPLKYSIIIFTMGCVNPNPKKANTNSNSTIPKSTEPEKQIKMASKYDQNTSVWKQPPTDQYLKTNQKPYQNTNGISNILASGTNQVGYKIKEEGSNLQATSKEIDHNITDSLKNIRNSGNNKLSEYDKNLNNTYEELNHKELNHDSQFIKESYNGGKDVYSGVKQSYNNIKNSSDSIKESGIKIKNNLDNLESNAIDKSRNFSSPNARDQSDIKVPVSSGIHNSFNNPMQVPYPSVQRQNFSWVADIANENFQSEFEMAVIPNVTLKLS